MKNRLVALASAALMAVTSAVLIGPIASGADTWNEPEDEEQIILGGMGQSEDPTRWDYVEEEPEAPGYQPRSAWGHEFIKSFVYNWEGLPIRIPTGTLAHEIAGHGTVIYRETAAYAKVGKICNYRIDFQNRWNKTIYKTWLGPTHYNCATGKTINRELRNLPGVKVGKQCARLYIGGAYRGEQCHNITK